MRVFSFCAILTLSVISNTVTSQTNSVECGTETTESDKIIYQQVRDQITSSQFQASKTSIGVPVSIHIIRRSDGSGGVLPAQVSTALDVANYFFQEGGIRFYQCGPVDFIDDDNFYSFQKTVDETLCDINDVANTINIYFADYLYKVSGTDTTSLCGYAFLSGPKDRVLMKNSCTINGSTLSHELGHYFSLLHTHSTSFGNELVDGSNCSTAGDQFCDTPADPVLSYSTVNSSCDYTGSSTDANGQAYAPDVANLMSYSRKYCRSHLSTEQSNQMAYYLVSYRNYLTCTQPPEAAFSPSNVAGCNGESITFTDESTGNPISWNWTFADGTPPTSNLANPQVVYDSSGTYSVSLMATNANGSDFNSQQVQVTIWAKTDLAFVEDFEGGASIFTKYDTVVNSQSTIAVSALSASTGFNGLVLAGSSSTGFTTPPDSVAFLMNPSHFASFTISCLDLSQYLTATLTYDRKLAYSSDVKYTNFRMTIDGVPLTSVLQPSGPSPNWNFISVDLNPYIGQKINIGFESNCKYGVANSAVFIDNINISGTVNTLPPTSAFTASDTVICDGDTITFSDQSSAITTGWSWSFPGGSPSTSNEQSPSIVYSIPGIYNVTQVVNNSFGSNSLVKSSYITVQNCSVDIRELEESSALRVFPNPSHDQIEITYKLQKSGHVKIDLLDIHGRIEKLIIDEPRSAGYNNEAVRVKSFSAGPGIYVLRFQGMGQVVFSKVIVL